MMPESFKFIDIGITSIISFSIGMIAGIFASGGGGNMKPGNIYFDHVRYEGKWPDFGLFAWTDLITRSSFTTQSRAKSAVRRELSRVRKEMAS